MTNVALCFERVRTKGDQRDLRLRIGAYKHPWERGSRACWSSGRPRSKDSVGLVALLTCRTTSRTSAQHGCA